MESWANLAGFPPENVTDDQLLRVAPTGSGAAAVGGFDSLDFIEFVMEVEEECAVKLPDAECALLETIGDVVAAVEKKRT